MKDKSSTPLLYCSLCLPDARCRPDHNPSLMPNCSSASLTADAKQTNFYFLPTCIHASFSQSKSLWISFLFGMIVDLILVLLFKYVIKWEHKWSTLVMSVVFYHLFLTIKTTCSLRVVAHVIEMLFISPFHILLFSLSLNEVVKHNIKIK